MLRNLIKRLYYYTLTPSNKVLKAEVLEEAHQTIQHPIEQRLDQINQKVDRIKSKENSASQKVDYIYAELERVKELNLEFQRKLSQQVADEFVKMYKLIDEIKCDRTEVKLNVTLVNELVKIHQSIESLKYERNGREHTLSKD